MSAFLSFIFSALLVCSVSIAQTSPLWEQKLNELWRQASADKLENGAMFALDHMGRGTWLPQQSVKRLTGEFDAKINWSQIKGREDLRSAFNVHSHPPRTLENYLEENFYRAQPNPAARLKEKGPFNLKVIADPPSTEDVLTNFEKFSGVPEAIKGRIKFKGVVLNNGGAWAWELDQTAPKLPGKEVSRLLESLQTARMKFVKLSAQFDGKTELMMRDTVGYMAYRDLVEAYKALGIQMRFFGPENLGQIIAPPEAGPTSRPAGARK